MADMERARAIAREIEGRREARAILRAMHDGCESWWIQPGSGRGLNPFGLTTRRIGGHALTDLGLAVRRILEAANND